VKLYGDNRETLEHTAELIQAQMAKVEGLKTWASFRIVDNPTSISRWIASSRRDGRECCGYPGRTSKPQSANTLTQVQQGEARYDVTVRYQNSIAIHADDRRRAPADAFGRTVSLAQLTKVSHDDGAEQINREGGSAILHLKYSVRGAIWVRLLKRPSARWSTV